MVGRGGGRSCNAVATCWRDVLKVWPVSRQVNSPRNNGAELLEAIGQG